MFDEIGKEVSGGDYDKKKFIKYSEPSIEEKNRLAEICKK